MERHMNRHDRKRLVRARAAEEARGAEERRRREEADHAAFSVACPENARFLVAQARQAAALRADASRYNEHPADEWTRRQLDAAFASTGGAS